MLPSWPWAGGPWSSGEESPEAGLTVEAAFMLIAGTIFPDTRRQNGISFGGQTHLGSNPSSFIYLLHLDKSLYLSLLLPPFVNRHDGASKIGYSEGVVRCSW